MSRILAVIPNLLVISEAEWFWRSIFFIEKDTVLLKDAEINSA